MSLSPSSEKRAGLPKARLGASHLRRSGLLCFLSVLCWWPWGTASQLGWGPRAPVRWGPSCGLPSGLVGLTIPREDGWNPTFKDRTELRTHSL